LAEGGKLEQTYLAFNAVLEEIKRNSDVTFIYTSKYLNDKTSIFILDAENPNSVLFSPFGSRDSMDPAELQTLLSGESTVTRVEDDSVWGTYLSAYAPIKDNRDGSTVGLVGVDYSEDYLLVQFRRFGWVLNISFTVFTLLISIAIYILIVAIHERNGIDDLTKLGNKRAFLKGLQVTLEEAKKTNQNFVLCMLDVNSFKAINDTYGHPVGDSVLRCIGRALMQAVDKSKGCYRYGGDEFAVLLPNTTLLQAQAAKKSMEDEISAIDIPDLKGMRVSASIGMAEWLPGITAETLIDLSDKDLYVQKLKKHHH
jgi:diguanylate cyclase (GGDEF)-like protein